MKIIAIDPGPEESAFVRYDTITEKVDSSWHGTNKDVCDVIKTECADHLVIEKVKSYGMTVGQSVFDTCEWTGDRKSVV